MPIPVRERFLSNIDRVQGFVSLYEAQTGPSRGRPSVQESDILRAAVVLLHATLEDLLRSLAMESLPRADREVLQRVPFVGGDGRKTTLTLGDLCAYRETSVEGVITASVALYLDRRSYNNTDDLVGALKEMDLSEELVRPHASRLQVMMLRRHHIAHQLDANDASGSGQHPARSLGKAAVTRWLVAVRTFGLEVLTAFEKTLLSEPREAGDG